MRIATSTIYAQQAESINDLSAQYMNEGLTLSSGKSLNAPSDDPTQIGQDLDVRTTITVQKQQQTNITAATAQLTSTDSALASLTSVLQSARSLATRGASDLLSPAERKTVGAQVDQYLQQAVAIANTQYGGNYIFGGSAQLSSPPVTTQGTPIATIGFSGNLQAAAPMLYNGQSFALSPTLQQTFNYSATDGSSSVFSTLVTLRDTLNNGLVTDKSSSAINVAGQVIYGGSTTPPATTLGAGPFAVPPKPDSNGNYAISINSTDASGAQHVQAFSFNGTTPIDDGVAGGTSIVAQINATTATTGLGATFDAHTQRLVLTNAGGGAFSVTDEPSAGPPVATGTSNFSSVFRLQGSATLPATVSTQLGDIDKALDVVLNGRSLVGSRINALAQINTQVTTDVTDNTSVQSGIEDTTIATATTQFSATKVALDASYSTTTQLESKHLFDYL